MQYKAALLGGLSLGSMAVGVTAGGINDAGLRILGRGESFEAILRQHANDIIGHKERRQAPSGVPGLPAPSVVPASGDAGDFNFDEWARQTQGPCQQSIAELNGQASNPTGMAVCYNAQFFDDRVFVAGLRLYNVSMPTEAWAGLALKDMSLVMSYPAATVSLNTGSSLTRRDTETDTTLSWPPIKERAVVGDFVATRLHTRQTTPTNEVAMLTYFGELDLGFESNDPTLQQFLVPNITLMAVSPQNNQEIRTDLASPQVSFQRGIFSQASVNATSTEDLQASASAAVEASTPFKIPGVTFGVPPIGFIITMVWTVLFVGVVGAGTFGRYQFREQYRRRMRRELAMKVHNI